GGPAGEARGRGALFGGVDCLLHRGGIERRAVENPGGRLGPERRLAEVGEPDGAGRDRTASEREHDGGGGGGIVPDLALELLVGRAMSGGRNGNLHRGEDFAGPQRGEIGALVEVPRWNATFACFAYGMVDGAEAQHDGGHVVARIAVPAIAPQPSALP